MCVYKYMCTYMCCITELPPNSCIFVPIMHPSLFFLTPVPLLAFICYFCEVNFSVSTDERHHVVSVPDLLS